MASIVEALQAQQMAQQGRMAPVQQQMDMQTFLQNQAMQQQQMQQSEQNQDLRMQALQRAQQQDQLSQKQASDAAGAAAGYLRNPEMLPAQQDTRMGFPATNPSGYGPDVRGIPVMKAPEMAPMTLQTVANSIVKNNPKISPEALLGALKQFEPRFEQEDKIKLANLRATQAGKTTDYGQTLKYYLDQGLPYEEAQAKALQVKRQGAEETEAVSRAREKGKGNISEVAQKEVGQEQLGNVVQDLATSYDQLKQLGGVVSTSQPAIKNVGAYLANTGLGQVVGGMAGTTEQSLRDSIAQSRPLLINAIRKATGMGAKAMDSNTELQFYLAAATDPTRGVEANRRALDSLVRLYGLGQENTAASNTQAAPASANIMDFNQLPE